MKNLLNVKFTRANEGEKRFSRNFLNVKILQNTLVRPRCLCMCELQSMKNNRYSTSASIASDKLEGMNSKNFHLPPPSLNLPKFTFSRSRACCDKSDKWMVKVLVPRAWACGIYQFLSCKHSLRLKKTPTLKSAISSAIISKIAMLKLQKFTNHNDSLWDWEVTYVVPKLGVTFIEVKDLIKKRCSIINQ